MPDADKIDPLLLENASSDAPMENSDNNPVSLYKIDRSKGK